MNAIPNARLNWAKSILNILLIGWIVGAAWGAIDAAVVVAENNYLDSSMRLLASQLVATTVWHTAIDGLQLAVIALLLAASAWMLFSLALGSSMAGLAGALAAAPVLFVYVAGGIFINRNYLPGFFEATSMVANAVLTVLAAVAWKYLYRWVASRRVNLSHPFEGALRSATLSLALVGLLATLIGGSQAIAILNRDAGRDTRANILIVLIDTLRADRLGAYGYERDISPNLDALAKDGWLFTDAIAQAPWTKPSIASMFTSLYPGQTSVSTRSWTTTGSAGGARRLTVLSPQHVTLAELLAASGYETAAFGKNNHLEPQLGFSQGFLTYEWDTGPTFSLGFSDWLDRFRPEFWVDWIHDRFLKWLDRRDAGPFFVYLHHIDVHWPYKSPKPFSDMFDPIPEAENFNARQFISTRQRALRNGSAELSNATLQAMNDAYDEGVSFVDHGLGTIFREMQDRGLYDNTLIVITSDHGEEFLEHGAIAHGHSLYDELIRVPLIIKFPCPGIYCDGRRIDRTVELIDILPTVLSVADVEVPDFAAGKALTTSAEPPMPAPNAFSENRDDVAIVTPRWKLISNLAVGSNEVFDREEDPLERINLADTETQVGETLSVQLADFIDSRKPMIDDPDISIAADDSTLRGLRALGYVE